MWATSRFWALLLFVFVLGFEANAGDKVSIGKLGKSPPFAISGWRYQLVNGNVHVNFCASSGCERGSKVSFLVAAPKKDYTFEQYKAGREKIAQELRKMAPAGTRITFANPELVEDYLFRIYKTTREEVTADGKTTAFISELVIADKASLDFISSASSLKKAEEQLAPFMLAGMVMLAMPE